MLTGTDASNLKGRLSDPFSLTPAVKHPPPALRAYDQRIFSTG